MKSIYTYYKERLIEISGKNKSLYLKTFNKKNGYDIGRILESNQEKTEQFLDSLLSGSIDEYVLTGKDIKEEIFKANGLENKFIAKEVNDEKEKAKIDRQKRELGKKLLFNETQSLKALKREIEEIEKETGRYELFICYPFVYGSTRKYSFRAPLLMFPVNIDIVDDNTATISLRHGERVQLNKALMLAISDSYHLNLSEMDMEFDNIKSRFTDLQGLLAYLREFGVKIDYEPRKNLFNFNHYPEPRPNSKLEIKNLCLLSRCSISSSIYTDYSLLEKKHLTNDSINELLNTKTKKKKQAKQTELYLINNVDYAQEQVVRKVNESGNMVIYGPPGTGKSQTIVNVISDSIAKNKKVLVVSQKKAALEVIYNRMGLINSRAMFMVDSEKERRAFYDRVYTAHTNLMNYKIKNNLQQKFDEVENKLKSEESNLKVIADCLYTKTEFGLSLQEMYYNSYKIGKKSSEYAIYKDMLKDKKIMKLNYDELSNALSICYEQDTPETYYNFVESKKKNLFIDHLKEDLSVHTVTTAVSKLKELTMVRNTLFDIAKYKYSRQILTYLQDVKSNKNIKPLIKLIAKFEYPKADNFLSVSKVLFPLYPFAKVNMNKKEEEIKQEFEKTLTAIDEYIQEYDFLKEIMSEDGYLMALDGILNGNSNILRLLLNALENYIELRDTNTSLKNLEDNQKLVLNFAYKNSNSFSKYMEILNKLLPIRIYHEIVKYEDLNKQELSYVVDFENIRNRIVMLKQEQNEISKQIASQSFALEYQKMINGSTECKDYLYQISKKQNFWSIRRLMEVYGEYLLKLFPCWLLSPENVSLVLPLKKDMFDLVLFDEASQVFIENTIPSIYRGKTIVVAGDAKQLRPTTTFMKRYMGDNTDDLDYSTQAALEVESLLDLAVSRFNSTNITYHYRSKNEELIDFSNNAFYNGNLQISPNVSKNIKKPPIERILVDGRWSDRKNIAEANKVVELIKHIIKTRKNNETIGVITFNSEQESLIEDVIDKECYNNEEFRRLFIKESSRIENGEDVSIFVKNLENVQGDERDIIIFSIGYAPNEYGKVNASFGSLSNEGGENRLNVAITRAKKQIYVVTSIEPEQLKVDSAKFAGPKLLKAYLSYARAVSNGNKEEVKAILNSVGNVNVTNKVKTSITPIEEQIAEKLEELGYKCETNLGNSSSKISVAVYDKKKDLFLLGLETDETARNSSASFLERDVYRNEFLKSKGWRTYRVWSRDFWHNSKEVINNIVKEINKASK